MECRNIMQYSISRRKSVDSVRRWNLRFRNEHWSGDAKNKRGYGQVYSTMGQITGCCQSESHQNDSVTIIGSKQPGNYSISSLATVYNALFLGGGPVRMKVIETSNWFEIIKYIPKLISISFWSMGINRKRRFKDNDVIRIPAYNQGLLWKVRLNVVEFSKWNRESLFWFIIIRFWFQWVCLYSISKCTSRKRLKNLSSRYQGIWIQYL
jgi:hypothetical protein